MRSQRPSRHNTSHRPQHASRFPDLPRTSAWIAAGVIFLVLLSSCEQRVQMAPRQPAPSRPETTRPAPGTPGAQSQQLAQVEQEIFQRINQQRREEGLAPLDDNPRIRQLARDYSRHMARESFFSHTSPDGEDLVDRAGEAGLRYSYIGENIFKSVNAPLSRMPEIAVEGWMDSPGHRRNILREAFTETGIGAWKQGNTVYITQVFRRPR